MASPPTILVSAPQGAATDELTGALPAGFAVAPHTLGATPAVDLSTVAVAVIDVADRIATAAAQTRRWRVELGGHVVPILWVQSADSPELTVAALDAGADACLARPLAPAVFAAQIRALARCHANAPRLGVKAGEARLLGDQLRKAYAQLDGELELARRVHHALSPRTLPQVGSARVAVCHRPRGRTGGDFHDVRRLDEEHVGFFVGDVTDRGVAAGCLLGLLVKQVLSLKEISGNGYRLVPPDEALVGVNRELLALGRDDPPLVALLVGTLNAHTGAVTVARAGLPAPVHVPAGGEPHTWLVPGPFLGTADTGYQPFSATLAPGDKLVVGSDGTRPDGDAAHLLAAAARHRGLSGQAFVDAVARELLPQAEHPDDFTLLVVEMIGG